MLTVVLPVGQPQVPARDRASWAPRKRSLGESREQAVHQEHLGDPPTGHDHLSSFRPGAPFSAQRGERSFGSGHPPSALGLRDRVIGCRLLTGLCGHCPAPAPPPAPEGGQSSRNPPAVLPSRAGVPRGNWAARGSWEGESDRWSGFCCHQHRDRVPFLSLRHDTAARRDRDCNVYPAEN